MRGLCALKEKSEFRPEVPLLRAFPFGPVLQLITIDAGAVRGLRYGDRYLERAVIIPEVEVRKPIFHTISWG